MRLIRWYRESPPRLRVVFRIDSGGSVTPAPSSRAARPSKPPNLRRILVVCFGNVGRSPVAASLLQERLDPSRWEVVSAGTNALDGRPASRAMSTAAGERGIDLSAHRAQRVAAEDLASADLVIAMSQRQIDRLLELEPRARRRIRLLGAFNPQPNVWNLPADPRRSAATADEIPDPNGEDVAFHRECCDRLETSVDLLARWIIRRDASRPLPPHRPPLGAPALQSARLR